MTQGALYCAALAITVGMAAQVGAHRLGVPGIVALLALADSGTLRPYASPFPGQFPGTDEVNRRLRLDQLHVVDVDAADWVGRPLADAPFAEGEFAVLLEHRDQVYVAGSDHVLSAGDRIVCLRPDAVGDAGTRSAPRYSA